MNKCLDFRSRSSPSSRWLPRRRGNAITEQLFHRPDMLSDASRHRRRSFYPSPPIVRQIQHQTETLMRCAKVVDTPHQIHRSLKRLELAGQSTSPTYQNREARAKCPIKPFDVAHLCSRRGLCLFYQGLYPLRCTPNDASDDPHHSPGLLLRMLLDDLHDAQMVPKTKSRTSPLASEDGGAKDLLNRRNRSLKPLRQPNHQHTATTDDTTHTDAPVE